jgi:hypothetical protein
MNYLQLPKLETFSGNLQPKFNQELNLVLKKKEKKTEQGFGDNLKTKEQTNPLQAICT